MSKVAITAALLLAVTSCSGVDGEDTAEGNDFRPDGMTLRSMSTGGNIEFLSPQIAIEENHVTLTGRAADLRLEGVLEQKRCVDSMSGARYSFAATVDVDGQRYQGCALEGQ